LSAARANTTAPTIKAIETIAWSRPRSRFANPSREEMELHGLAIAGGQHKRGAGAVLGTNRTEQVRRFSPLIVSGAGA
jgi:hypothetical protein